MLSTAAAIMSLEASDVQTEGDCDDLLDDGFSFSADISELGKTPRKRRSSHKPPPSPRSPYLSSLNMNPRRSAVAAWKPLRTPSGDSRGDSRGDRETFGEAASARLTSLSNGHGLSQTVRVECDGTSDFLRQTLRKHRLSRPSSNGYTPGTADYREKEDMYDEIIHLKKSIQAQKTDNQQLKAKLRRLEEDKSKREKQIEELLDPTKASEYTRSLVDKKKEGSVIINGLKQRILKLEQQCREKEKALSKLQSELRTTNLEELKTTVETYFEEIQRLRMLLEAAEKSSRAESKGSQRQQKALSSTVLRLSENLKQLQQENSSLREELNTESPSGGVKGYREWSKQRLVRRLLELEKRLEDSRRHAHSAKSSSRLDQEVQTMPTEILDVPEGVAVATEAAISVGTAREEGEELLDLRGRVSQLEKEREGLRETLTSRDEELRRLMAERGDMERETGRRNDEEKSEREKERQKHKEDLERLCARIQTLEEERTKHPLVEQSPPPSPSSPSATTSGNQTEMHPGAGGDEDGEEEEEEKKGEDESLTEDTEEKRREEDRWRGDRENSARTIQRSWRAHRERDVVTVQSALRGHLLRHTQLRDLQRDAHNKVVLSKNSTDVTSSAEGELDMAAVTTIQSVFRGHLTRCGLAPQSSLHPLLSPLGDSAPTPVPRRTASSHTANRTAPLETSPTADSTGTQAVDSDDSDDIIVSPSRPSRHREADLS